MGAKLFRRLLGLLPADFRDEMGAAMAEAAAARVAALHPAGGAARLRFWARECAGLVRVAIEERLRSGARPSRHDTRRSFDIRDALMAIRVAARRLRRAPGFTIAAFLTLALAFGGTTAIWAVVKNVVMDPLPYPDSERLVLLEHGLPGVGAPRGVAESAALHALYRDEARSLDGAAMYTTASLTLTGRGEPESLEAVRATPPLLGVLRVTPALGRWFDADAGRDGGPRSVVLSHALWRSRFGGDRAVLGTTVSLDEAPYEVIGVMPAGFAFPDQDARLWLPLAEPGADARVAGFNYIGIARLADGATVETLRADGDRLIARLPEVFPEGGYAKTMIEDTKLNARPVLLRERTIGSIARTLWVLLATVGLVLLLACANVANLFLVRADARHAEMAVRRALGAGRRVVATQFLAESALLAAAGGAAGVGLAAAGVSLLRAMGPDRLPRMREVTLDGGVLGVALLLCAAVALLVGLLPLARGAPSAGDALQAGRRTTAGSARVRARNALVAAQVALAVVLLVACGLMGRSFVHMTRVDPGFEAEGVLTFRVGLPETRYPDASDAILFHERTLERLRGLPGVEAAAAVSCAPLDGWCFGDPLQVQDRIAAADRLPPVVTMRRATPGYFGVLSIPVRAGRAFSEADASAPVAVVNEALADLYFPGEDPIGRRVRPGVGDPAEGGWLTIIGVVGNTATSSVTEENHVASIYFPMALDDGTVGITRSRATYVVRASASPFGLVPTVRAVLRELDPAVALADVRALDRTLADSGARISFALLLLAIAACTALLLGAVGIYGVIAYTVSRRTGEIGVRLALGARPGDVVRMIVGQSFVAVGVGLVVGVPAALAFGSFMGATLFGVTPLDPLTYAAVLLTLIVLAAAATWIPARRAASLDAVSALRSD